MPLCALHILSLSPSTPIPAFLSLLSSLSPSVEPLVTSRVIRWIITPTTITANELLHPPHPWDLLIVLPDNAPLPASLSSHIRYRFSLTIGIPSRITSNFASLNPGLLHPDPSTIPVVDKPSPPPTTPLPTDSQNLTLSAPLLSWISTFSTTLPGQSPVSMLNLLAFHQTDSAKKSYQAYGKAFAERIGSRHGGNAKIVGNVITGVQPDDMGKAGWHEIAIAQYPTIQHFQAMLGSPDYQEVNQQYRVPSLRDTCILCTSEIAVEEEVRVWREKGGQAKL